MRNDSDVKIKREKVLFADKIFASNKKFDQFMFNTHSYYFM